MLRNDAGKQEHLSGLDKEPLLKLLTRIYDADMREETAKGSYEPEICSVQGGQGVSTEARLAGLEKENAKLKEDLSEVKSMMTDLCKELKQGRLASRDSSGYGQRRQTPPIGSIRCYRCQEMGHYARDCKNAQVCSYCRKEGHAYSACVEKSKND